MKAPTVKPSSGRMYAFNNPGLGGDGWLSLRLHSMEVRTRGRQIGEALSSRRDGELIAAHETQAPRADSPSQTALGHGLSWVLVLL